MPPYLEGVSDLLLPATDAGAIGQMVGTVAFIVAAAVLLRRHRDARLLAVGVGVLLLSLQGLRTIH